MPAYPVQSGEYYPHTKEKRGKNIMDIFALILTIIGGINWGLVGIFRFDLVAFICGGPTTVLARIIYTLVGIAAVWCVSLLFRENHVIERRHEVEKYS